MPRVLIADALSPQAAEVLARRGVALDVAPDISPAELLARIGDYEGIAVRSRTRLTADVFAANSRLKVAGRAGIGIDNIDLAAATARGVVVMNTPDGNAITTAEHTLALLLACARQLTAADRSTRAGKWEKQRFLGAELYDKTLGIVGCGTIGSIVADRARGLKMRVVTYDPYLAAERAAELGVERVDLNELLARADFVTLHLPLTAETRGLIDAAALARMKPGARLINCARGGLVDEAALAAAIRAGRLAGAALDVFAVEPARDSPLFALDETVLTPHLGAATVEAQEKVALQLADQMADFLLLGAVRNALNMPAISAADAPRLRPYLRLCEQIGSLTGQILSGPLEAITIEFEGQVAELDVRPLGAAALMGLLAHLLDTVNMVNAPLIARERRIPVTQSVRERSTDYLTLVRLRARAGAGGLEVTGTLFADNRPGVVQLDGIAIEAELSRHMLFVRNADKPGFIGALGTVLGAAGINIATFHLGRTARGGEALALIVLDEAAPEAVLAAVRVLPQVREARALCCM